MENFCIIKPSTLLAPYVSHYWTLKAHGKEPVGERIIPTGSVSLIFHRADLMMSRTEGKTQPRTFVSGVSTGYSDLQSTGIVDMLAVVFKPSGSGAFFSVPLDELRNMSISVYDTGDRMLEELALKVLDCGTEQKAVEHIEQFLSSRLYRHEGYGHRRIEAAINAINGNPATNVTSAAGIACLSTKQFNRIFSTQVGVRPKEFMRIVRFQRALYTLQLSPLTNLAQLAAGCGYYDQAHMIKDFREFSGYTPLEYIASCAPYSDYFTKN